MNILAVEGRDKVFAQFKVYLVGYLIALIFHLVDLLVKILPLHGIVRIYRIHKFLCHGNYIVGCLFKQWEKYLFVLGDEVLENAVQ
jgi:hypothetical protein